MVLRVPKEAAGPFYRTLVGVFHLNVGGRCPQVARRQGPGHPVCGVELLRWPGLPRHDKFFIS